MVSEKVAKFRIDMHVVFRLFRVQTMVCHQLKNSSSLTFSYSICHSPICAVDCCCSLFHSIHFSTFLSVFLISVAMCYFHISICELMGCTRAWGFITVNNVLFVLLSQRIPWLLAYFLSWRTFSLLYHIKNRQSFPHLTLEL